MKRISPETEIRYISNVIEKNIMYYSTLNDKGFLSENILAQLRNLVEDVAILANNKKNNLNLDTRYENINPSIKVIQNMDKNHKEIAKLYDLLLGTASHYTPSEDGAEKLLNYYFRYICIIKNVLKENYNIDIINNIEDFPMYDDKSMKENYEIICSEIDKADYTTKKFTKGKFYIEKVNTIYSKGKIYYEITLTKATDYVNKFERITMYSKAYIPDNYSVNIAYEEKEVRLNVGKSRIKIIKDYKCAIRICELNNILKIFGLNKYISNDHKEYRNLMDYLTQNNDTITDILTADDENFLLLSKLISHGAENHALTNSFEIIRDYITENKKGSNVIKYLCNKLENIVIRDQMYNDFNYVFSELKLKPGCGMFDEMPYAMSLVDHNTSWMHLIKSIDMNNREYELLYRKIKNNTEINNVLYTPINELKEFDTIGDLISTFNSKLSSIKKNPQDLLMCENGYVYIKSYESNSLNIIDVLEKYANEYDNDLRDIIDIFCKLDLCNFENISSEKINILKDIFGKGKLALIYGPAGTGKTKMLELLSTAFKYYNKYFISVTHTAVNNLKMRISAENSIFQTIAEFITAKNDASNCDILFIDECSMVSNIDIKKILEKSDYKAIVMVGDICQIESIKYSNWFELSNRYFNKNTRFELSQTHRTHDEDLIELWDCIRNNNEKAVNILSNQEYTQPLNNEVFNKDLDDEIILCLNYDGMYGINNINKVRQSMNDNLEYQIGVDTYRIGDRILFNDCPRFKGVFYNNLKGIIKEIYEDKINKNWVFTIEIDKNAINIDNIPLFIEVLETSNKNKINVKFNVNEYADIDDDENKYDHIIPFNLAYAISIHKAQGLEYDCVKIIITSNIEEMITKNIFYTAITRAKQKLKVYWNTDTQTKVFDNFKKRDSSRDIAILIQKIKNG